MVSLSPPATWSPALWRSAPARQQPEWPDADRAEEVRRRLAGLPPLVFAGEARRLTDALAEVAAGRAFLLQAGDCAESFHDFTAVTIREKLKLLLQMAAVLTWGATLPVVKVGRIAGQFVKPRSSLTERIGDLELPSFRGHMVNGEAPVPEARVPDPERMLAGYHQSAATLNLLRAFTQGGFADLTRVHMWNQEFVAGSREGRRYERIASEIERALRFLTACGVDVVGERTLHQVDLWTSHEGLLLDYEEALTRRDSLTGDWYDCSAHMLWIGERTRQLDGAHVDFFAGVGNPIGCKLGPEASVDDVLGLCERLNPRRVPGRLTLITRMGAGRAAELLPPLLAGVREAEHPVVWVCDPMHANVFTTASGRKTRHFDAVMTELEAFFAAHREQGTWPGGIHLEFTGDDVTECLGGSEQVDEEQLDAGYMSLCDPRLNGRQSLDLAFRVAELMRIPPGE
ncbi:MAG: 3-deoxy-7-phosphoheptulonate synthase class II [Actinobacteria bacterium]|nr:3-deoxy-7-phosphoheptulonate synthase class II [Actinomycetota bacterium]